MRVAAGPVDHRAAQPALVGGESQDVAPDGGIGTPAVIDHHDMTCGHVIDKIAHRAERVAHRRIGQGEGAASQAEAVVERLDPEALARDAELVERIAERCGVELGRTFDTAVW